MRKIFLVISIFLLCNTLYAAPLQFSPAPDISSYLSDDFQNNILPKINPVADACFKKAVKKYMQIYPSDGFTLYQNKIDDKLSIKINKDYLTPNSTLSMQVYLIENQGEFSFVEIFRSDCCIRIFVKLSSVCIRFICKFAHLTFFQII